MGNGRSAVQTFPFNAMTITSFSCGIVDPLLVWDVERVNVKKAKVVFGIQAISFHGAAVSELNEK